MKKAEADHRKEKVKTDKDDGKSKIQRHIFKRYRAKVRRQHKTVQGARTLYSGQKQIPQAQRSSVNINNKDQSGENGENYQEKR